MLQTLRPCGQQKTCFAILRRQASIRPRISHHQYTISTTVIGKSQQASARHDKTSLLSIARRSYTQTALRPSQFQPLRPPSPESLGKPKPARTYRRTRKLFRRLLQLGLLLGGVYLVDAYLLDAVLMRCTRTFSLGLFVALDYKINFRPNPLFADSVADVHRRNAERLFHLLRENGGLYLKIGQAIAMQSAILPPEFQKMFAAMFDDAPQNSWEDVRKVIREEFGKEVEEVFGVGFESSPLQEGKGVMERTARASASVAQVHWARLPDGREVAIKIQKREINRQVSWDLWAFKYVSPLDAYLVRLLTLVFKGCLQNLHVVVRHSPLLSSSIRL